MSSMKSFNTIASAHHFHVPTWCFRHVVKMPSHSDTSKVIMDSCTLEQIANQAKGLKPDA
jgi:hypothetical protein